MLQVCILIQGFFFNFFFWCMEILSGLDVWVCHAHTINVLMLEEVCFQYYFHSKLVWYGTSQWCCFSGKSTGLRKDSALWHSVLHADLRCLFSHASLFLISSRWVQFGNMKRRMHCIHPSPNTHLGWMVNKGKISGDYNLTSITVLFVPPSTL